DQAWKSCTGDGAGASWPRNLTAAEVHSVDVKIGQSAFDPRDQRRPGPRGSPPSIVTKGNAGTVVRPRRSCYCRASAGRNGCAPPYRSTVKPPNVALTSQMTTFWKCQLRRDARSTL